MCVVCGVYGAHVVCDGMFRVCIWHARCVYVCGMWSHGMCGGDAVACLVCVCRVQGDVCGMQYAWCVCVWYVLACFLCV